MNKLIRDGKVGVLVSGGFGAGWITWNAGYPECLFSPEIIEMVERKATKSEIEAKAKELFGSGFYAGGADGLQVEWLPVRTKFYIDEYDGSETLQTKESLIYEA